MEPRKRAGFGAYVSLPLATIAAFTLASLFFIFILGDASPVPVFVIFCSIQVLAMALFALLPGRGKTVARVSSMFLIGSFILVLAGVLGRNNFQLEGFFFYALSGAMGGVIVHFAVGKILGPVLFSRSWCSWGCWTGMVLDTLPYRSGGGWRKGLARIRVVHFVLSLALVAVVYFMLRRSVIHTDPEALKKGMGTFPELVWFLSGNALYYMAGIGLAIGFRDNRAFCKYLCPITVFLRLTNRVTLTRIKGDKATCTSCGTCTARCPMSIDIPAYVKAEERVASTECIVCMNCVAACPEGALKTSIGLDLARRDLLRGDESLAVLGGSQAGAAGEAGGEIGGRGEPAVQGNFRN